MIQEIIYTSAPQGLRPGTYGFCTVAATAGMPASLIERLEALSGYRHLYPPGDAQASRNPVVFSHVELKVNGRSLHILSRVADAGLDYSQRSNKLAHHVVLDDAETLAGGPAWLLQQAGFLTTEWTGPPRALPRGKQVPRAAEPPQICRAWQYATGDAGWAGVLAQHAYDARRPAYLVVPEDCDVLALLTEALALLPERKRWKVSFCTCFTKMPAGIDCLWRCVIAGSPEADAALSLQGDLVLDLTKRLGPAPESPLVTSARTGQAPAEVRAAAPSQQASPIPFAGLSERVIANPALAIDEELRLSLPPAPPAITRPPTIAPPRTTSPPSLKTGRPWATIASLAAALVLLVGGAVALALFTDAVDQLKAIIGRQRTELAAKKDEPPEQQKGKQQKEAAPALAIKDVPNQVKEEPSQASSPPSPMDVPPSLMEPPVSEKEPVDDSSSADKTNPPEQPENPSDGGPVDSPPEYAIEKQVEREVTAANFAKDNPILGPIDYPVSTPAGETTNAIRLWSLPLSISGLSSLRLIGTTGKQDVFSIEKSDNVPKWKIGYGAFGDYDMVATLEETSTGTTRDLMLDWGARPPAEHVVKQLKTCILEAIFDDEPVYFLFAAPNTEKPTMLTAHLQRELQFVEHTDVYVIAESLGDIQLQRQDYKSAKGSTSCANEAPTLGVSIRMNPDKSLKVWHARFDLAFFPPNGSPLFTGKEKFVSASAFKDRLDGLEGLIEARKQANAKLTSAQNNPDLNNSDEVKRKAANETLGIAKSDVQVATSNVERYLNADANVFRDPKARKLAEQLASKWQADDKRDTQPKLHFVLYKMVPDKERQRILLVPIKLYGDVKPQILQLPRVKQDRPNKG